MFKNYIFFIISFLFFVIFFFPKISLAEKNAQFSPQQIWSMRGFYDGISKQSDEDFKKFVNPTYPLNYKKYKPQLVSVSGSLIDQAGRHSRIRSDIKPYLDALAKDFYEKFETKIVVVSAFRDYEYQKRLWDLGRCDDGPFCALPGHSEHQLWLALDLFDPSSQSEFYSNPRYVGYVNWLKENAYKYGWVLSYKYGYKEDGYNPEPWHWRYVGVDLATRLHELDWNYTRLIQMYKNLSEY